MNESLARLITEHRIHEVECVIPDMTGIARGKILPKDLFLGAGEMRLPKSVLLNTVNGQQPDNGPHVGDTDPDMVCRPDAATFRVVPWAAEPVAVVIHDCFEWDGTPVLLSPRAVLRRVIELYTQRGWFPVVAPEMEFYLVARQQNPHEPLQPPIGRSGKTEAGRQSYSIDAVNDFDPLFMELSSFCEAHRLGVETLIHEAGAGQMEINFSHGDPMDLADRVFLFKRTVRETALRHGIFAPSWPSRWRWSPAARCTSTRAWSIRTTGRTSSRCPTAARARSSCTTSPVCKSTFRRCCRCWRRTSTRTAACRA